MYYFETLYLPKTEYAKIVSEINTNYGKYEGKPFAIHTSYGIDNMAYHYYFENHGFNKYNIYMKTPVV